MRDINRIDILTEKLNELWKECPDLRLGQLISNLNCASGYGDDVFRIEDDILLKAIEFELKEVKAFKEQRDLEINKFKRTDK